MYNEGTIIALSSPPGSGAISIIRLSGKDSISKTDKFFESKSGKKLKDCNGYSISYGNFLVNKEVLDEVVISLYKGPHSYTCLLYTSPSPRDKRQSRMPSSA